MSSIDNRLADENKDLHEWKRILSRILEYSAEISTLKNIREILYSIVDVTKEVLQADRCTVFLFDRHKNELFSWVAHGLGSQQIRFSADKGLAGYVAKTGETINVEDAYKDERFNPDIDKSTGYKTNTILCMPMKNHLGEIIGVFQVLNKKSTVTFSNQDIEILRLLSLQAAADIESSQLYEELKKSFSSFIYTLAEALDARDPTTAGHSHRVCGYSMLIAENIGYSHDDIEILKYSSLLHDLGKIGVKEAILTKPDQLTEEEYCHIQKHAEMTRKILERTYFQSKFREIPLAASSHHENLDGSGYPNKLVGEQIHRMARIMAVADVFDALTYRRHYRVPMALDQVITRIVDERGKKFDPECVDAFLDINIYDMLKVMTKDSKQSISKEDQAIFEKISLKKFIQTCKEGEIDGGIAELNKYYPVQFDEEQDD